MLLAFQMYINIGATETGRHLKTRSRLVLVLEQKRAKGEVIPRVTDVFFEQLVFFLKKPKKATSLLVLCSIP